MNCENASEHLDNFLSFVRVLCTLLKLEIPIPWKIVLYEWTKEYVNKLWLCFNFQRMTWLKLLSALCWHFLFKIFWNSDVMDTKNEKMRKGNTNLLLMPQLLRVRPVLFLIFAQSYQHSGAHHLKRCLLNQHFVRKLLLDQAEIRRIIIFITRKWKVRES